MAAESGLEGPDLSDDAGTDPVVVVDLGDGGAAADAAPPDPRALDVAARLDAVAAALRAEPHSFGFFQAVRLLERLDPERERVGGRDPASEAVRFRVNPGLGFPASEIQQLEMDGGQPVMTVNFMGLTGPQGVLPHQYSLLVAERLRARDTALADFLDLFHHRLLSLFYRAWLKYRFTIAREDAGRDALAAQLGNLIGLGLDSTHERLSFPDEALIHRTGLLIAQARGAVGLEQLLVDFFGVDMQVEQFVGGWYPLQPDDRCVLGADDEPGNQLGGGAVAGDEVWDQQARVRIRAGPLTRRQYDDFLPGGSAHNSLRELLRYFSHDQFVFELQLVLAADDVPGVRLGAAEDQRLGWGTWIRSAARGRDADETLLTL